MKHRNRHYSKTYNKNANLNIQVKKHNNTQKNNEVGEIYEIPEKFIFSPTTCASSEENKKAVNCSTNNINTEINENTSDNNNFFNGLLDKILNDDFLLIGIIAILLIERFNLKKSGADKNILNEYDLMIAALIYIYF